MQNFKVVVNIVRVGKVKLNALFSRRVNVHRFAEVLVLIFPVSDSACGVQVQSDFKPALFNLVQKGFIVGEELFFPTISRPTRGEFRPLVPLDGYTLETHVFDIVDILFWDILLLYNVVRIVPVHIDSRNR